MNYARTLAVSAACWTGIAFGGSITGRIEPDGIQLILEQSGQELLTYRLAPLQNPKGGDAFKGSNFIHPLKTPSGFSVTDFQPHDHLHHFGLWWPWKQIEVDGRKLICWELQRNQGLIMGLHATALDNGFTAESDYIDRTVPSGPRVVLKESIQIAAAPLTNSTANGYYLDIEITHRCATEEPVTVSRYRYSGFAFRGTALWNKYNSTLLTNSGKNRAHANFSRAEWIRAEGKTNDGGTAGVLIMGHPKNHTHPERLRTWNNEHGGAVFVNFNPVQDHPWRFEPGQDYVRRYRLFIYDGTIEKEQAERLWKEYENESRHPPLP